MTNRVFLTSLAAVMAVSFAYAEGEGIVTSKYYVDTEVAKKQANLAGSGADVAVTFPDSTGGTPNSRSIGTSVTAGTNLVTTGGVNTALNEKQQKISGDANTVVTYTGTSGGTGQKAVYSSTGSYTASALAEAGHVNSAVTNGFNAHITCSDCGGAATCNTSNCLLYSINDLTGGTYVPHN